MFLTLFRPQKILRKTSYAKPISIKIIISKYEIPIIKCITKKIAISNRNKREITQGNNKKQGINRNVNEER
jgi:hypothetical protein